MKIFSYIDVTLIESTSKKQVLLADFWKGRQYSEIFYRDCTGWLKSFESDTL